MFAFLISLLVSALAVVITAYLLPGVYVKNYRNAILVALLIGLVNWLVEPVLIFLTLPLTFITLGLFLFVINALMIMLVSAIMPSFKVKNFVWALAFSIVLSFVNGFLNWIF
jgi:putative membrane protein